METIKITYISSKSGITLANKPTLTRHEEKKKKKKKKPYKKEK